MPYSSGPGGGVIPHPLPEVNFLMVEIPTPKPYIFMITRPNDFDLQLGCCISDAFSIFYNFNILIFFRKTDQLSGSKFDRGDPVILLKTCTIL